MKKLSLLLSIVSIFAVAGSILVVHVVKQVPSEPGSPIARSESKTISHVSFSYRTEPDGFIAISNSQNLPENSSASISLFKKQEYEWSSAPGFVGEGPPKLTVSVFKNPDRLTPQVWAETYPIASNIELIDGSLVSTEVGGAEGVHYVVLGLYLYDTYVFAYGDEIYLLSGAYHERGDEYYQNTRDVLATIVF